MEKDFAENKALTTALGVLSLLRAKKAQLHQRTATSDSVLVLCIAITRGRARPAGLATAVTPAWSCPSLRAARTRLHQTTLRVRMMSRHLCSTIPGGQASPTAFATVAPSGQVVWSAPVQKGPSFTRRPFDSRFCRGTVLCDPRGRASPTSSTTRRRWECLSLQAKKTQLPQKTLRVRRRSLAHPSSVPSSAAQETRR